MKGRDCKQIMLENEADGCLVVEGLVCQVRCSCSYRANKGSEKGSDGDVDLSITAWGNALGCPTGFKSQGKKL